MVYGALDVVVFLVITVVHTEKFDTFAVYYWKNLQKIMLSFKQSIITSVYGDKIAVIRITDKLCIIRFVLATNRKERSVWQINFCTSRYEIVVWKGLFFSFSVMYLYEIRPLIWVDSWSVWFKQFKILCTFEVCLVSVQCGEVNC